MTTVDGMRMLERVNLTFNFLVYIDIYISNWYFVPIQLDTYIYVTGSLLVQSPSVKSKRILCSFLILFSLHYGPTISWSTSARLLHPPQVGPFTHHRLAHAFLELNRREPGLGHPLEHACEVTANELVIVYE